MQTIYIHPTKRCLQCLSPGQAQKLRHLEPLITLNIIQNASNSGERIPIRPGPLSPRSPARPPLHHIYPPPPPVERKTRHNGRRFLPSLSLRYPYLPLGQLDVHVLRQQPDHGRLGRARRANERQEAAGALSPRPRPERQRHPVPDLVHLRGYRWG